MIPELKFNLAFFKLDFKIYELFILFILGIIKSCGSIKEF
jgi:hypothetical protein